MTDTNKQGRDVNKDLGQTEMDQQEASSKINNVNDQDDNPLTHADNESAEATAARQASDSVDNSSATRYADRNRGTAGRANEATDRNDTNTGGMGAGGGNSAGQIK
jgi:hypothetical protein